ncbi:hypothetical protein EST35_0031 [Pseudomonas phage vB_PaeM_PA5oct]|uniref:Uncharacterized protein n=1 Tax=Pseudomonas phage vB_PaeM_PA5oct TaxID=2163605 RepID=A0A4Y5JU18_9CAUD|nr:hypothetical protein PQE65_gp031 [Pseudomonas phage vB_PaeM_PA5oct]QCG75915.1 hypothetical protein EST35_0031 [Pseudomonas phage vB_PaeM_PA5oct]
MNIFDLSYNSSFILMKSNRLYISNYNYSVGATYVLPAITKYIHQTFYVNAAIYRFLDTGILV